MTISCRMPRKALKILVVNGTVEEHDYDSTLPSTTLVNQLSERNAKHSAVLKSFSKLRIVDLTADKFDKEVQLWDYSVAFEKGSGGRSHSSVPLICLNEANGVVIVNGSPVDDILKSNKATKLSRLPLLWLSSQSRHVNLPSGKYILYLTNEFSNCS